MKNNLLDKQSDFLLYTGNDGKVNVEVFLKDETVRLTQKAMAELFGVNIPAVGKLLSNIFESGGLQKEATLSILETVQMEGNRQAKLKAEQEYEVYLVQQDKDYISDFDKEIKRIFGEKDGRKNN